MRRSFAATLALAAAFVLAPPASAQQGEFGGNLGDIDQGDADRSTIMRFLETPEVGGAAASIGVDVQVVGRKVLTMSDADAALVADRVRDAEEQMAANITITTTALIIGLLVLIVLILVL